MRLTKSRAQRLMPDEAVLIRVDDVKVLILEEFICVCDVVVQMSDDTIKFALCLIDRFAHL